MTKKALIGLFGLLLLLAPIGGIKALQIAALIEAGEQSQEPTESVTTAVVQRDTWRQAYATVGNLVAFQGVLVSSEASGIVRRIGFVSGQTVEEGQLLVEIDARAERAELKSARARAELARLSLERAEKLRAEEAVPQSELDAARAEFDQARAEVENLEALIDMKRVRAPFSGRLGIRLVNLGEYLEAGAPVASLQALDPIYADFSLPQKRVGELAGDMKVEVRVDAFAGRTFEGRLSAVSPEVAAETRTVRLRATLSNPEGKLLPGMFASVAVVRPQPKSVVAVPATAILHAPYGDSVYIVEENEEGDKIARQRFVRVGETRGDFAEIEQGVQPGQTIVSTGVFKLRNGVRVTVNNELALDPKLNPEPRDS